MDQIIQEIFEKHEVRKSKKQKTAFIAFATEKAKEEGYPVKIEKGSFGVRNIVAGDPENAKVIYTAHYDTCARLPFPNFLTPKNIFLYILYNIAVTLGFCLIFIPIGAGIGYITGVCDLPPMIGSLAAILACYGILSLMIFGPANKHTANDNTSGVTVLFGIMKALPKEEREKAAFVFFDHEESGLLGSSAFADAHKSIKKNTLLLNFDCVSDGRNLMILTKKDAVSYTDLLTNAFASNEVMTVDVTKKALYPSDQMNFKKGVGIAAFNKTKGGMLYMNRIHTPKDTVYRRENIDFLIDGAVKFTESL